MRGSKKISKLILKFIYSMLLLGIAVVGIDITLITFKSKPLFCRETAGLFDGGTRVYQGFGYQIIDWNQFGEDGKRGIGIRIHFK